VFGFIVLYVSSRAVMNDRGGARLTSEESLQAVVDVVPGVIGLGGNCHRQDESHHRRQANARRIASFKSHDHNSSSGFEQDVKQNNPCRLEKSRLFVEEGIAQRSRRPQMGLTLPGGLVVGWQFVSIGYGHWRRSRSCANRTAARTNC
jgi:hypothetical protein